MPDRRERRRGVGIYDRRIQILEPVIDANDYNEDQLSFEIKYDNFPAGKLESVSEANEAMEGRVVQSASRVDWQLRFVPDIGIKTSWKIKDLFSGLIYEVIAPIQEVGRREAWLVKTQITG